MSDLPDLDALMSAHATVTSPPDSWSDERLSVELARYRRAAGKAVPALIAEIQRLSVSVETSIRERREMSDCLDQYRMGKAHGSLAESKEARNDTAEVPEHAKRAWHLGFDDGWTTNLILRGTQAAFEQVQRERDAALTELARLRAIEKAALALCDGMAFCLGYIPGTCAPVYRRCPGGPVDATTDLTQRCLGCRLRAACGLAAEMEVTA